MTKKDYVLLSKHLREKTRHVLSLIDYMLVCETLAEAFEKENPSFNKDMWRKACDYFQ